MEPIVITPIVLTMFGETLDMVGGTHFWDANCIPEDEREVPFYALGDRDVNNIGRHESDKGVVRAVQVSKTHYVLSCGVCGRIGNPIPVEINTYGKLRKYCTDRMNDSSCRNAGLATIARRLTRY